MPGEHPGLKKVVMTLSLVILVSSIWAFWPDTITNGDPTSVEYRNESLGLLVKLPQSWEGFQDISAEGESAAWHGTEIETNTEIESGPMIILRHPAYTDELPRQDIPLMVFTLEQWQGIELETFVVGAAPIPPSELARNASYVFALPARYNYSFLEGSEEVDQLLRSGIVSAF